MSGSGIQSSKQIVLGSSRKEQFKKTLIHSGIVAMIGGVTLGAAPMAWAADAADVESLQRENEQLRKELRALKGEPEPATAPAPVAEAPAPAVEPQAAAKLQGVVVSAKKTLQTVKDQPQSISVVSGEDLRREDAVTLEAITKRMANVKWNYGNSSTSNYSIRGLGKIANVDNGDPSVGLYVDGVAYAFNQMGYFNFVDVDTVEVARGPQGTAFGKNANLGAIRVNYKKPSFTSSNEVIVGISKYEDQDYARSNGSVKATAISTGPLVDGLLAYRTTLNVDKGGGWILNSYNPDNRYISSDRVSGRLQLLLTPTENFNARLAVEVNPRNSENVNIGSTNFFFTQTPLTFEDGRPNSTTTTESRLGRSWFTRNASYTVPGNYYNQEFIASDTQQGVVTGSNGATLELNWVLGETLQLSSITSGRDYYFNAFRDDEGTVFDVQTAAGQNKVYKQYGQEFRLTGTIGEIAEFQSGLFYQNAVSDSAGNAIFGTDAGAWYASGAQYGRLDTNGGPSGRLLLNDSLADFWKKTPARSENNSTAIYANADWHVSEPLTINTGVRFGHEKRELAGSAYIEQQGYAAALSPGNLGGFNSSSAGALLGTNSAEQVALANGVASRYFGVAAYDALSTAQKQQVADAKAIRNGRIGVVYDPTTAPSWNGNVATLSIAPRYEFTNNVTGYVSASYGEKAGVPALLATASPVTTYELKKEKNTAFELGSKTTWFGGDLQVNAALYLNDIKNYQQNVQIFDAQLTVDNGAPTYSSVPGNVPKVRAQGLELDGVFTGIEHLSLRFAGAYNDAYYKKFPTLALPVERGNETTPNPVTGAPAIYFIDGSGKTLPGASKWSFNVGANYEWLLNNNKFVRSGFTTTYASRYNSDNALSSYGWISAQTLTDASIAFGDLGGHAEVAFFVKNVFNDDTPRNRTWNAWAPGFQRQFGLTFTGRL